MTEMDGNFILFDEQMDWADQSAISGFTTNQNERPVIVLGATNDEDDIDPALLRPGRFDRLIKMDVPDMTSRSAGQPNELLDQDWNSKVIGEPFFKFICLR